MKKLKALLQRITDFFSKFNEDKNSSKAKKPFIKPFIIKVKKHNQDKDELVKIFGADKNIWQDNCGNSANISIEYDFESYWGGGVVGYRAFLAYTQSNPFNCGRIRVECENIEQLRQPMNYVVAHPNGTIESYPIIHFIKSNQVIHTAVDTTTYEMPIHGGTEIEYNVLKNNDNKPIEVRIYFYPIAPIEPKLSFIDFLKNKIYTFFKQKLK